MAEAAPLTDDQKKRWRIHVEVANAFKLDDGKSPRTEMLFAVDERMGWLEKTVTRYERALLKIEDATAENAPTVDAGLVWMWSHNALKEPDDG